MQLENLGWDPHFEREFQALNLAGAAAGRVGQANRGELTILADESAPIRGQLAGRLRGVAVVAGDWVAFDPKSGRVEAVLPRRSCIQRGRPGGAPEPQPLAANVDIAFVVCGLDGDFNPRRIERYLVMIRASGARAAVVLNKSDLHPSPWAAVELVRALDETLPVVLACGRDGAGIEDIEDLFAPGETAVLLGSSGAGKSTLTNRFLGWDRQRVAEVRTSDSRGRHATTTRELIVLPSGRLMIDTAGLREVQPWSSTEVVDESFADIAALASACRFRDCSHQGEPGCAVEAAVRDGLLTEARRASFVKLKREAEFLESRADPLAAAEQRRREKRLHRQIRRYHRVEDH